MKNNAQEFGFMLNLNMMVTDLPLTLACQLCMGFARLLGVVKDDSKGLAGIQ